MKANQKKHPHTQIRRIDCPCRKRCLYQYRLVRALESDAKRIKVYDTSFLFQYPHTLDCLGEGDAILIPRIVLIEMKHHEDIGSDMATCATTLLCRIEALRMQGLIHITDCYNDMIPKSHNGNDHRIFCAGITMQQLSYPLKVILMSCDQKLVKRALRFGLHALNGIRLLCPRM